jgi:hypothetical protein
MQGGRDRGQLAGGSKSKTLHYLLHLITPFHSHKRTSSHVHTLALPSLPRTSARFLGRHFGKVSL